MGIYSHSTELTTTTMVQMFPRLPQTLSPSPVWPNLYQNVPKLHPVGFGGSNKAQGPLVKQLT